MGYTGNDLISSLFLALSETYQGRLGISLLLLITYIALS